MGALVGWLVGSFVVDDDVVDVDDDVVDVDDVVVDDANVEVVVLLSDAVGPRLGLIGCFVGDDVLC